MRTALDVGDVGLGSPAKFVEGCGEI